MSCQARAGLLVLRMCGEPAMGACGTCGRPLCMLHQVMGGAGMTCPECAALHGGSEDNEQAREAANRNDYYNSYGEPTEFGGDTYFSEGDHDAVRRSIAGGDAAQGFGEDYDPFDT